MITIDRIIRDKKQIQETKELIEKKLQEMGKNWNFISQVTGIGEYTLKKFRDLEEISESNLDKIMEAVLVSNSPKITPEEENLKKITPKWDYENFKAKVLDILDRKGEITNKDISEFYGKPAPYYKHLISKMEKNKLIQKRYIPGPGKHGKTLYVKGEALKNKQLNTHINNDKLLQLEQEISTLSVEEIFEIYKFTESKLKLRLYDKLIDKVRTLSLTEAMKLLEELK